MENPIAQNAGLIVTSPMRRTIQTAFGALDWLIDKGIKIEADARWQGMWDYVFCYQHVPRLKQLAVESRGTADVVSLHEPGQAMQHLHT
jgi:hypothetical protein